ncbi:hypothetical protein GCM10009577_12790 [Streptomyces javensis]
MYLWRQYPADPTLNGRRRRKYTVQGPAPEAPSPHPERTLGAPERTLSAHPSTHPERTLGAPESGR